MENPHKPMMIQKSKNVGFLKNLLFLLLPFYRRICNPLTIEQKKYIDEVDSEIGLSGEGTVDLEYSLSTGRDLFVDMGISVFLWIVLILSILLFFCL